MGMEFRPYYLAREWEKMGHNVRVVGATFSHLRKVNPVVNKDFEIQTIEGIEYLWVRTTTYEGNGIRRALTMFEFCSKLWIKSKSIVTDFKPDVVITSSTYPLDSFAGRHIANIARCKYIHEGHDLWPLTLTEIGGMSKRNPFVLLMAIGERYAYSRADHIVSVLPYSYKHMLNHGLKSKEKFTHIPNGVVLEDWNSPTPLPKEHEYLFNKLKDENKFIVCYLGGHALSNKLDRLIEAAALLRYDESLAFVLVGKGVEKDKLIRRAKELNLSNVYFLPPVEKTQVPSVLSNSDALYIGAEYSKLYEYGVSLNKVYDYMMAEKPIVYGISGAANNEVEEANAGITFNSDNPNNICEVILRLKNSDVAYLKQLGKNGKTWVLNNCEYSQLANKFYEVFK